MADDLVVPNHGYAKEQADAWARPGSQAHASSANLARAYLAVAAERDSWLDESAMLSNTIWDLKAQLTASEAARGRMAEALREARDMFNHYAQLHIAKSPPSYEKADANKAMANRMILALTEPGKAGEP